MDTRVCKTCGLPKSLDDFARQIRNGKERILPHCLKCFREIRAVVCHRYYENNKEIILTEGRERHHSTKEYQVIRARKYRQENKVEIKSKRNERVRHKRVENPSFKLRENISRSIRGALKENRSSKNGLSFLTFVGYTMSELKGHLEKQFEPWMTWENWGVYNSKTWNDNDSTTWTWQIDHVIPQSKLLYANMTDDNFSKCWSLNNLRPFSAKQNFLNGIELLRKK